MNKLPGVNKIEKFVLKYFYSVPHGSGRVIDCGHGVSCAVSCAEYNTLAISTEDIINKINEIIDVVNNSCNLIDNKTNEQEKKLKQEIEKTIRETLKGIDMEETESDDGWWETGTGAEFGKNKLNELTDNINKILDKSI